MSSEIGCPCGVRPIGTRSRSRCRRGRHATSGSKSRTSPMPSRSTSSAETAALSVRCGPDSRCSGGRRRAAASASASDSWSAAPASGPGAGGAGRRAAARVRHRPSHEPGEPQGPGSERSPHRSGSSRTVMPSTPSVVRIALPAGTARRRPRRARGGAAAGGARAEPGPVPQALGQQVLDLVERGRDHPRRADGVAHPVAVGVRGATWPSPTPASAVGVARTAILRCSGEWKVASWLTIDRARARASASVADDLDPGRGPDVDGDRDVALRRWVTRKRCAADAATGSSCASGAVSGGSSVDAERLVAHADADQQVVVVVGLPLPDPGPLLGEHGQRPRVGVVPLRVAPLLPGRLPHRVAQLGEVGEVLAPRPDDAGLVLGTLPPPVDPDEAERGDEEHAGGDHALGPPGCADGDEDDRADAAEHGQSARQQAADAVGRLISGGGWSTIWPVGTGCGPISLLRCAVIDMLPVPVVVPARRRCRPRMPTATVPGAPLERSGPSAGSPD